jgi:hypothetical protein
MTNNKLKQGDNRRNFIGKVTGAAVLMGVSSLVNPAKANDVLQEVSANPADPEEWFKGVKGKHRMVFDCTEPKAIFPFAWPRVFLMTNAGTGTPEKDCSAVVVLRHSAFAYALQDSLWAKYKFGEELKITDPETKTFAVRNPFWNPKPDDYKVPGIGSVSLGIADLQASGVMFCVCDVALTVNAAVYAMKMNLDPALVKKEWSDGIIQGIPAMPSGVWAVGRAQEHGCGYCYV